ncbi:hypothetical protein OAK04_03795, partial [Verrucomicrobia bacterium]|nr:hypothetical protein [Verrucomicrobiota bacterium]
LLIGISLKPNYSADRASPRYVTFIYKLLAIGIFSLGLTLVHSQWFSSKSIIFSDTQSRVNKIQNLYQLSINAAREKDDANQKQYIMSAIDLTENAIRRSPLDPNLHYMRGKLYGFLDGKEDKVKSSFKIESALDPTWVNLPLRQSQVWLFIDLKETRRLWTEVLERANNINDNFSRLTWIKVLAQARQHPIQIRTAYEIIMDKDDPYYIKRWMDSAGSKNVNTQIPKILKNNSLRGDTKNNIFNYWKKIAPADYERYLESAN